MNGRRTVVLVAGLAILLTGGWIQPAGAASVKWVAVHLGAHRFGHQRTPDAIVARAGVKDVGFECGKPSACASGEPRPDGGCGCIDVLPQGPSSFDVGRNGSTWLLDVVNNRLLVWTRGHAGSVDRSVPLPRNLGVGDFALGRAGTIYIYATPPGFGQRRLWALTSSGQIRWQAPVTPEIAQTQNALRMNSDGVLYNVRPTVHGGWAWTPLTSPAGRPLARGDQRRRTSRFEPLAGGARLAATQPSSREIRFRMSDRTGRVLRAWRVTSQTPVAFQWRALTPALVGSDLVVALDVSRQVGDKFLWEHVILRLTPAGAVRQRFALDARAAWDPDGTTATTTLRVGPDGRLYQLRTDPATGASIARYSLGS
jgi:hypothetical protein